MYYSGLATVMVASSKVILFTSYFRYIRSQQQVLVSLKSITDKILWSDQRIALNIFISLFQMTYRKFNISCIYAHLLKAYIFDISSKNPNINV